MRAIVFGTTGSGKSTFGAALAAARDIPFIELDLINWRPNWVGRNENDVAGFVADVAAEIAQDQWVATGSYGAVRDMMWARATDIIYLDLPRGVIMKQVIARSFARAFSGKDVFPGCREHWWRMMDAEHPIRWAWSTLGKRRKTYDALIQRPEFAHLTLHRCHSRDEADAVLRTLEQVAVSQKQLEPATTMNLENFPAQI